MIELDCYNKDIFIYFFVNIHVNFHSECFQYKKNVTLSFNQRFIGIVVAKAK